MSGQCRAWLVVAAAALALLWFNAGGYQLAAVRSTVMTRAMVPNVTREERENGGGRTLGRVLRTGRTRIGMQSIPNRYLQGGDAAGAADRRRSCQHRATNRYILLAAVAGFNNNLLMIPIIAYYAHQVNRTVLWPSPCLERIDRSNPSRLGENTRLCLKNQTKGMPADPWDYILERFETEELFRDFCIVTQPSFRPGDSVLQVTDPTKMWRNRVTLQDAAFARFSRGLIGRLLSSPRPYLKRVVRAFQQNALRGDPYVGVHVRNLGPGARWMSHLTSSSLQGDFGKVNQKMLEAQYTATPAYVRAESALAGISHPGNVFLAHDHQRPAIADALVGDSELQTKLFHPTNPDDTGVCGACVNTDLVVIDMLLLVGSSHFVGNDVSTLSWNVELTRSYLAGTAEPEPPLPGLTALLAADEPDKSTRPRGSSNMFGLRHNLHNPVAHGGRMTYAGGVIELTSCRRRDDVRGSDRVYECVPDGATRYDSSVAV